MARGSAPATFQEFWFWRNQRRGCHGDAYDLCLFKYSEVRWEIKTLCHSWLYRCYCLPSCAGLSWQTVLNHATQASINKPLGICRDLGDNSPAQDILRSTIVSACVWNDTWCCALVTAIFFSRALSFSCLLLNNWTETPTQSHSTFTHTQQSHATGFSTFKCLSEQFGPNTV